MQQIYAESAKTAEQLTAMQQKLDKQVQLRRANDQLPLPPHSSPSPSKKRVVVPESLMTNFLAVASDNSANNIETIGTLGGKLTNAGWGGYFGTNVHF